MIHWIRNSLLIFAITIFLLAVIELFAWSLINTGLLNKKVNNIDIFEANIYPDKDLEDIQSMFKEHAQIDYQWEPYLHQRAKPFAGKHINISNELTRKTKQYYSETDSVIKIFAFGGSTMFGDGARDAYTIPSWLSKMIDQDALPAVHITNFGNSAYIRTQENILLMRELQKGNIPDIVIFYDGVNDAISSGFHHQQGLIQDAENRIEEFNIRKNKAKLVQLLLRGTNTNRLIRQLFFDEPFKRYEHANFDSLGVEFLAHYQQNLKITDALAEKYKFSCINYWQPVVYTKTNLTQLDKQIINMIPYYSPYFKAFYEQIKNDSLLEQKSNYRNISHLLDTDKQYYYDLCHISEQGNKIIAHEIFKDIKELLQTKQ